MENLNTDMIKKVKLGTAIILDEKYEIRVVVTNVIDDNTWEYGDIYNGFDELMKNHPSEDWLFGFVVVKRKDGLIPSDKFTLKEFYETLEEAFMDYNDEIAQAHTKRLQGALHGD